MKNRIRKLIDKGYITSYLSDLLREEYEISKVRYPNSWDTQFIEDMIGYKKKLSLKQKSQIERILGNKILEEEFPNGIEDILKSLMVNNESNEQYPVLVKNDLLKELIKLGFTSCKPRTSSWKYSYILSNETSTIYFLIGKRGIDFKYYDSVKETKFDERGRLFTDGGVMVRNYYNKSKINVHSRILEIANQFADNKDIDETYLNGLGASPLPPRSREKTDQFLNHSSDDMVAIYNAVCHEYGEDAYLSDGVYIRPDGSLYEDGEIIHWINR